MSRIQFCPVQPFCKRTSCADKKPADLPILVLFKTRIKEIGMDATILILKFNTLLLQLSSVFTRPTAETFHQMTIGWLLAPAPGTITGMIRTLGAWAGKHWTVYEKFFYRARWFVSFRDMLATIRQAFWRRRIKGDLLCGRKSKEFIKAFTCALCHAA